MSSYSGDMMISTYGYDCSKPCCESPNVCVSWVHIVVVIVLFCAVLLFVRRKR